MRFSFCRWAYCDRSAIGNKLKRVASPSPTSGWAARLTSLPFTLTNAQGRAITDIRADFDSGKPMNRLLQGDVGSGKTVVAALAAAMITTNNSQAAIMAPTSILAEQHYHSFINLLATPHQLPPNSKNLGERKRGANCNRMKFAY